MNLKSSDQQVLAIKQAGHPVKGGPQALQIKRFIPNPRNDFHSSPVVPDFGIPQAFQNYFPDSTCRLKQTAFPVCTDLLAEFRAAIQFAEAVCESKNINQIFNLS